MRQDQGIHDCKADQAGHKPARHHAADAAFAVQLADQQLRNPEQGDFRQEANQGDPLFTGTEAQRFQHVSSARSPRPVWRGSVNGCWWRDSLSCY